MEVLRVLLLVFMVLVQLDAANCDDKYQTLYNDLLTLRNTVSSLSSTIERQNLKIQALLDKQKTDDQYREALEARVRYLEAITIPDNGEMIKEDDGSRSISTKMSSEYNSSLSKKDSLSIPQKQMMDEKNKKRRLIGPVSTITPTADETVAFYAYMSHTQPSPGKGQIFLFDVVVTNVGNGYHVPTGVFISPAPGYYVFTWTVYQYEASDHSVELVVNTSTKGYLYHRSHSGEAFMVSGTVVTHVNAGDDVFVRTRLHHSCNNAGIIISDNCGLTSFSGWKI